MSDDLDTAEPPRLLIAHGDPVVRLRLVNALSSRFDVVGLATDAHQAIALAVRAQPDVALIDAHMPGGGGVFATREIARLCPGVAICGLSSDQLDQEVLDILLAGADAYALKEQSVEHLEHILRQCVRAHPVLAAA